MKLDFMECDTCRAKAGSPTLCRGCLHNRSVISQLRTFHMTLSDFAYWVRARWSKNPRPLDLAIMTLGLCGEAGEVSEPIKKEIRGDGPVDRLKLELEIGDVLHYLCAIANHYQIDMVQVMHSNVKKMTDREQKKA